MSVSYLFSMDTSVPPDAVLLRAVHGSGVPMIGGIDIDVASAGDTYYAARTELFAGSAHGYPLSTQRPQYPYLGALAIRPRVVLAFFPENHHDHDATVARVVAGLMEVVRVDQGDFVLCRDDDVLFYRVSGRGVMAREDSARPWLFGPKARAAVDIECSLGDMPAL